MDPNSNPDINPNPAPKPEDIDPALIIEEKVSKSEDEHITRKYVKGKLLGRGGFARCFEVTNLENDTILAAKIVDKSTLNKGRAKQKLVSEIKIHKSVEHENVVSFERVFEDEDYVYILLELCVNGSMSDLIKRRKRLTETEVQCYVQQLVNGVKYLHSNKIIHRDLKLGNLLINDKMELKICDFGLAAKLENNSERRKTVCGTPNYIAPEIIEGGKRGHSYEVDVWSIGVITYTLLVGTPPFETSDVKSTYKKIKALDYNFPDYIPVSDNAKDLIKTILNLDAFRRPTLDEILDHDFFKSAGSIPKLLPASTLTTPLPSNYASQSTKPEPLVRLRLQSPPPSDCQTPFTPLASQTSGRFSNAQRTLIFCDKTSVNSPDAAKIQIQTNENLDASPTLERPQSPDNRIPTIIKQGSWKSPRTQTAQQKPEFRSSQSLKGSAPLATQGSNLRLTGTASGINRPKVGAGSDVCVKKWYDQSSKYGMGYTLSNGHTGVLFVDNSKIVCDSKMQQIDSIQRDQDDMQDIVSSHSMDNYPKDLQRKITLLQFFKNYLEGSNSEANEQESESQKTGIYVKQWTKTKNAIMFRFNNKTVQVIFTDRTEIIMSSEHKQVTFVNKKGERTNFPLSTAMDSTNTDMTKRLKYSKDMLSNMVNGPSTPQGQIPSVGLPVF